MNRWNSFFMVCFLVVGLVGCPVEPGDNLTLAVSLPNGNDFVQGETVVVSGQYSGSVPSYRVIIEFDDDKDGVPDVTAEGLITVIDGETKINYSVFPSQGGVDIFTDVFGQIEIRRPVWTTINPTGESSISLTLSGADGQTQTKVVTVKVPVLGELDFELTANGGPFAVGDFFVSVVTLPSDSEPPYHLTFIFAEEGVETARAETLVTAGGELSWPTEDVGYTVTPSSAWNQYSVGMMSFVETGQVLIRYHWTNQMTELEAIRVSVSDATGSTVTKTIQAGAILAESVLVSVPDVVGLNQEQATTELLMVGLLSNRYRVNNDHVPFNQVFGQDPLAGEGIRPGHFVDLQVSVGPQP